MDEGVGKGQTAHRHHPACLHMGYAPGPLPGPHPQDSVAEPPPCALPPCVKDRSPGLCILRFSYSFEGKPVVTLRACGPSILGTVGESLSLAASPGWALFLELSGQSRERAVPPLLTHSPHPLVLPRNPGFPPASAARTGIAQTGTAHAAHGSGSREGSVLGWTERQGHWGNPGSSLLPGPWSLCSVDAQVSLPEGIRVQVFPACLAQTTAALQSALRPPFQPTLLLTWECPASALGLSPPDTF